MECEYGTECQRGKKKVECDTRSRCEVEKATSLSGGWGRELSRGLSARSLAGGDPNRQDLPGDDMIFCGDGTNWCGS